VAFFYVSGPIPVSLYGGNLFYDEENIEAIISDI
jgi:hypothetical protein